MYLQQSRCELLMSSIHNAGIQTLHIGTCYHERAPPNQFESLLILYDLGLSVMKQKISH